ncbi:conjugal transfer mating-pair stabilization protein TraG [Entomohabitans teleogrylli]|uniref:conjugal transfer mating-pair stabilization protein TraG n=1 Tax=Entomohabitans teleogrylli TaxID=1384589 RepID=UPI00073D4511|nr:conjugal transfer mating-pair stabilization protein TraG [Entomohabitans teleogrylli]
MDAVYVLAGGEFITAIFNGVATIFGTTTWSSMFRIAALISVMTLFAVYLKGHDPKEFLKFIAFFILLTSVMIIPKRTVQIIDRSNPTWVATVANVPVGLAAPAKFITGIGTGLTEGMEAVFHTVDSVTYSRTGMLFGSALVVSATDFTFKDGNVAELFTAYVRNCVVGDILLNNKYTLEELMHHSAPYELIFSNPSPLRGIMVTAGNTILGAGFRTCQDVASPLSTRLNADTSTGGSTWRYYSQKALKAMGGSPSTDVLFGTLMADSYNYYYGGGRTASEIMRASVVMNGIRQGLSSYSANSGDAASLINLASQSSYNKMRLSQSASADIAVKYIPVLNTVLLAMVIGLFPLTILLATVHVLTTNMLKLYICSWIYLQSWAPMFAILNYAVDMYLRTESGALNFNLASLSSIKETHADIGAVAGWLSVSIPFLAIGIAKGFGTVMSQAGNYLGTAINSTATTESSRAGDGLWSFNNMQMDNVAGNKWDTNYSHREGQMTQQLASGASVMRTADGGSVYNTSESISKLPLDIQMDKLASSGLQRQQREAMSQVQSLSESLGHSASLGSSQLSQWASQRGNSNTMTSGADKSTGTSETAAVSKLHNLVSRYAKDNNISESEALKTAVQKSVSNSATAAASAGGRFDTGNAVWGKAVKLGTGLSGYAEGHVALDKKGTKNDSYSIDGDLSSRSGNSRDFSAQELKDIRDSIDVITNNRASKTGSFAENESGSLTNQLGSTLSDMRTQATQYNDAINRSHEYSQMASYVENNSAAIRSNYTQEFVGYVRSYHSSDADRLLTDSSSPEVRMERERLAEQFAEERMLPSLRQKYQSDKQHLSDGIGGVSAPTSLRGNLQQEFANQTAEINQNADKAGVRDKGDISENVRNLINDTNSHVSSNRNLISENEGEVKSSYTSFEAEYQNKQKNFDTQKATQQEKLDTAPGTASKSEMEQMAKDMMKDSKRKK